MKKDKYLRARGGTAKIYDICCASCGYIILNYQKDGMGYLHRCYLNRIVGPKPFSDFQNDSKISKPSDLPNLDCLCGEIVGIPMRHSDGRLAYRLERGKYRRIITKNNV